MVPDRKKETPMLGSENAGKTRGAEAKPRFVDRLTDFLHRYRVVLLVTLIVLVVFVVAYFSWSELHKRTRERSTLMAERAQELYEQWLQAEERESLEQELEQLIDQIVDRYPRQYAAQRAFFIRGNVAFENEQWQQAADSYQALADSFPEAYLAPLSLFNAGAAYEQADELDQAIAAYQAVAEEHPESFLVPHALFSLGRLYEAREEFENAFQMYDRLEDEYPLSNWTKIGRNRIIELEIEGRIAE
jgi:TolA-binding protein